MTPCIYIYIYSHRTTSDQILGPENGFCTRQTNYSELRSLGQKHEYGGLNNLSASERLNVKEDATKTSGDSNRPRDEN